MNRKIKWTFLLIFIIAITGTFMLCGTSSLAKAEVAEREITASGTTGDVNWTFYSDGELLIYGEGAMADYGSYSDRPWNQYRTAINSIKVEEGVTAVGERAFYLTAAKKAEIASSVVSIGNSAFTGSSNLEEVILEEGIKTIGANAFVQCYGIKSIDLPDSLTAIGMYCFRFCKNLESIVIPDKVYDIGSQAFWECSSLKEITFSKYTKSLGSSAFYGCTALENVYFSGNLADWCKINFDSETGNPLAFADNLYLNGKLAPSDLVLPDTLSTVSANAFYGASFIESVTIPENIKKIGNHAFDNCKNLKNVVLPESLQTIGWYAFQNCSGLSEIRIPKSVTAINSEAFKNCTSLTAISVDTANAKYSSDEYGVLFNKDKTTLIQYPLGNKLQKYAAPKTVLTIKDYAFYGSANLSEIHIPEAVESVEKWAFHSSGVTDIYYGSSKENWLNIINNGNYSEKTIHFSLKDSDKSVIISYTDDDFDSATTGINLEVADLDSVTSKYEQNGFYTKLMVDPIRILDIRLVDGEGNAIQPLSDQTITVKIKAPDSFMNLLKNGLDCVGEYDVKANNIDFIDDCFVFEHGEKTVSVPAGESFLKAFSIIHWHSDAEKLSDFDSFTHDKLTVENGYIIFETDHFSEYAVCTKAISFLIKEIVLPNSESTALAIVKSEDAEVIYTSSDKNVALVDENGVVTAAGPGTATITATISGTDVSDTCIVTVPARNFTVKWVVDGVVTEQTTAEQAVITEPETPEKEGYTFIGWTPAVPNTMPAQNLEFTAVWQVNEYTITFDTAGGSETAPLTLGYGSAIIPPPNPTLNGYVFKNWTPEIPDTMPANDLTVTAVYEKVVITGIKIASPPNKTHYTYKIDSLDLSGLTVKVIFSDGSSKLIADTDMLKVYGFSTDSVGTKTIAVAYGSHTAELKITVSYAWWQQIIRILFLGFIWY